MLKNLKTILQRRKAKKGFTLVELLVVIAIIAILASVSVVGYLGFTNQARQNTDMQELVQYRDLIYGELLDGSETVTVSSTDYTVTYAVNEGTNSLTVSSAADVTAENAAAAIKQLVVDGGTTLGTDVTFEVTGTVATTDAVDPYSVATVKYHRQATDTWAVWTIETNAVAGGKTA